MNLIFVKNRDEVILVCVNTDKKLTFSKLAAHKMLHVLLSFEEKLTSLR